VDEPLSGADFPPGFLWGTATSAYQVEGSPLADGAGPSTWHRFSHTPGRTFEGETGDVACDHYRRWADDVRLMRDLGLTAYRFSVAWGRVLPEGRGRINAPGLAFYDRLVDALLEAGIQPLVTLYHWDLPAALDDRGGWLNPDIAGWFADYATTMFHALDDRVTRWATINEPWVITDGGYLHGKLAPGHASPFEAPRASHHLLLAHAQAVRAYRAAGRHQIGLVVNLEPKEPASESEADARAVARADAYMNRQYLDPVYLGRYPEELREVFGEAWPAHDPEELEQIGEPIDFLGVNYYTRKITMHDETVPYLKAAPVRGPGIYTETDWEVHAPSFTRVLKWVRDRYGNVPIYITENGAAFPDPPTVTGDELEDPARVAYLRDHITAVRDAMRQGVDVRGYFAWSLLDNFEWAHGTSKRFGLVHVDYATQKRTPKSSARFLSELIASRSALR
jgi:beta-glucosidase